jgi:hypothetical protein
MFRAQKLEVAADAIAEKATGFPLEAFPRWATIARLRLCR